MDWLDALLANVFPVLIVMSLVAVLVPALRRGGAWRGIGVAWLATLLIAVTHPNERSLSCDGLGVLRTAPTGVTAMNAGAPCTGTNSLPLGLVALPSLIGIGILLAWLGRHEAVVDAWGRPPGDPPRRWCRFGTVPRRTVRPASPNRTP